MFILRFIFVCACLGMAGWYLEKEQRAGRFQRVDELFLDLLVANARERLSAPADASQDSKVVFVALREDQRSEYASWPPPPLDWQTLLKGLRTYEPSALVIATPLGWGKPAPDFIPAVGEALLPFTHVIQAVEALPSAESPKSPPSLGDLEVRLPPFQKVDGESEAVPQVASLASVPEPSLCTAGELGLVLSGPGAAAQPLPYALRLGDSLVPSLLAQTLARLTASPYAWHRIRLGPGAGAYLREGRFVPLRPDGRLETLADVSVPVVNALDLMTGTLADTLTPEARSALGRNKVVVVGLEPSSPEAIRSAWLHAQALEQVLRLPKLHKLGQIAEWCTWGMAALAAVWIVMRVRRARAVRAGLALIFMAFVCSFIAFQSSLLWFPPTLPASLLIIGALVGGIMGKKAPATPVPPAAAPATLVEEQPAKDPAVSA